MKATILNIAVAASLATGGAAQPHHHGHHEHHKRGNSPAEKREVETTYVPATVTQYMLGSDEVGAEEAKAGLDEGLYVVVGETTPTFTPPPVPAATTSSSSKEDAVFLQKATSSSSSTTTPTTTSAAKASATSSKSTFNSGATGIDADFPDGEIDCDKFPSDYGAIPVSWMNLGGWTGVQLTPNYSFDLDSAISFIETAVSGFTQGTGFYSYACPDGYVKSQWPSAQGATGQSIGGLYCNSDGKLELTRKDVSSKLCQEGAGGVTIKNNMSSGVAVCRTDYPGTECMNVPVDAKASSSVILANVESSKYYEWQGKSTTLQYYVNKAGVSVEDGCRWDCDNDHDACGNWAPLVLGVGKSSDGTTYISLFQNSPTTTEKLDFNIEITGDVAIKCYYRVGEGFAVDKDNGCTTGLKDGGEAVIKFSAA